MASGDACVYGLGELVLERLGGHGGSSAGHGIAIDIIPGITAANAAAALLGAPLMNDYLVLSLSDLLTDAELIRKRLRAAAEGDLVVALYNPRSATRTGLIREARSILLERRPSSCPVGIVRNAYREGQRVLVTTLGELEGHYEEIDMFSVVIVGNGATFRLGNLMVSPRGYQSREAGRES